MNSPELLGGAPFPLTHPVSCHSWQIKVLSRPGVDFLYSLQANFLTFRYNLFNMLNSCLTLQTLKEYRFNEFQTFNSGNNARNCFLSILDPFQEIYFQKPYFTPTGSIKKPLPTSAYFQTENVQNQV